METKSKNLWIRIKSHLCFSLCMISIGQTIPLEKTTVNHARLKTNIDYRGPFSSTLDSHAGFLLTWRVTNEIKNTGTLELSISIKPKYHWVGIGFADETDTDLTDWFIGWHSRNDNTYYQDCNTMHDGSRLHIDKMQNYYVVDDTGSSKTLNVTIERKFNTGDSDDIEIMRKPGSTPMVFAYGHENTFAQIRSVLPQKRRELKLDLFPPKHSSKKNEEADKDIDNVSEIDDGGDEDVSPLAMKDAEIAENASKQIQRTHAPDHTITDKPNQPLKRQHSVHLNNTACTGLLDVIKIKGDKPQWYELFKFKENSVYYAIIGSSAILTGIIVLVVACCCFKTRRPRVSKVAFYKVDDYDEENVEFLKERA